MAAQVDNLIEKRKEKEKKKALLLTEQRKASVRPAPDSSSSPLAPLSAPHTQISQKYANETSTVGVGEMYRRTFVNVTASVDKKRLAMNEITTENLLGLKVNQKVADLVTPP